MPAVKGIYMFLKQVKQEEEEEKQKKKKEGEEDKRIGEKQRKKGESERRGKEKREIEYNRCLKLASLTLNVALSCLFTLIVLLELRSALFVLFLFSIISLLPFSSWKEEKIPGAPIDSFQLVLPPLSPKSIWAAIYEQQPLFFEHAH